jgi:hypothetical protein
MTSPAGIILLVLGAFFLLAASFLLAESFAPAQGSNSDARRVTSDDLPSNGEDVQKKTGRILFRISYIDDSLSDLKREVPELKGLDPAPNQEPLNAILTGVGKKSVNPLLRTPNIVADEEVTTRVPGTVVRHQEFGYLAIVNRTLGGATLKEHRTDKHGSPVSDPTPITACMP